MLTGMVCAHATSPVKALLERIDKGASQRFVIEQKSGDRDFFELDYQINRAGAFKYAFRMFPKNADLPHRMDFCYVRWF